MKSTWQPWLAVTVAIALQGVVVAASPERPMAAPAIELHAASGPPAQLSDYKGKVVLVDFWASWCTPCQASFPVLDGLYRQRHQDGLEVLAINVDEVRQEADKFLARRPHAMPVFFDPKGRAPEAFKVGSMPSSYLLDRQGRIRFKHVGFTSAIAADYEREIAQLLSEEASAANH